LLLDEPAMINLRPILILILMLMAGPVNAQNWSAGAVARTLEGPTHEELITLMVRPETKLTHFETDGI
jgi:hypothetical protein